MAKPKRTESALVKGNTKPNIGGKLSEHDAAQFLDLDRLLKFRLVVARFGEMDIAKWWNTKGQLGRLGATALLSEASRVLHSVEPATYSDTGTTPRAVAVNASLRLGTLRAKCA